MFRIFKINHVLNGPPKIYSLINFSYQQLLETISLGSGYFATSVKALTMALILPLVVENKYPCQYGKSQTRTHYLWFNRSIEKLYVENDSENAIE